MFGKRKRPWSKYAYVEKVELNNGDVKFRPFRMADPQEIQGKGRAGDVISGRRTWSFADHESLDAALDELDAWWSEFWPAQVKSKRRA